jgi:hypothetical protein
MGEVPDLVMDAEMVKVKDLGQDLVMETGMDWVLVMEMEMG